MNKSVLKGNIAPVAILLTIILLGGILYLKYSSQQTKKFDNLPSQSTESAKPKTFKSSSLLKFSVDLPEGFSAEEKLGQVTISSNDVTILITSNGTNFDSLEDYLNFLDDKNKNKVITAEEIIINGHGARKRTIVSPNDNAKQAKEYFILVDGRVFLISTESNTLVLDQIAQSFRYMP